MIMTFAPKSLKEIILLVGDSEPEPSVGRNDYIIDCFKSANQAMFSAITSHGCLASIKLSYRTGYSGVEALNAYLSPILDSQRSVCVQILTFSHAGVVGPRSGTLLLVTDVKQEGKPFVGLLKSGMEPAPDGEVTEGALESHDTQYNQQAQNVKADKKWWEFWK